MPINFDSAHVRYLFSVFVFGDPSAQARWQRYLAAGNIQADPNDAQLMRMLDKPFTRIRSQLCDDRSWYSSAYFNEFRRPMDQDDLLYSHLPLPQYACSSGFGFTRSLNDPPFDAVHRKLLHLFHHELGRMWMTPALSNDSSADVPLSPRMRQTLDLLASGKSEKQVATHLGISRHTVHDHVKQLHRRTGASSLGELLARTRPQWRFRPHLGLQSLPPPLSSGYNHAH